MRLALAVLWAAGLGVAILLIGWYGFADVAQAIAAAGWGLVLVVVWHAVPLAVDALGWRVLIPGPGRPSFWTLTRFRWYSEAVNTLLPVAQVGGDVLRGHLLAKAAGRRFAGGGPLAGATIVVDLTTSVFSQLIFSLIGVLALVLKDGSRSTSGNLLIGLAAFSALIALFLWVQRSGLLLQLARRLEQRAGGRFLAATGWAVRLDLCVRRLYRRRAQFQWSFAAHLASWLLGVGEVWLAAWALGHPISLVDALILESLVMAVRTTAFFVPGALGVQEGTFLVLGALVGLPPEAALALSLIKRVRELAFGLPALVAWRLGAGWSVLSRPAEKPV